MMNSKLTLSNLNSFSDSNVDPTLAALQKALASFGVAPKHLDTINGPRLTRYVFELPEATRLARLVMLGPEVTAALAAPGAVTITAPLPDSKGFAVDVPHAHPTTVYTRTLWHDPDTVAATDCMRIPLHLGLTATGRPLAIDLASCPHLLIAGSAGSGKSVLLNSILEGLLHNVTPDRFKMCLIDLKTVELSRYSKEPNLLRPIQDTATDALDTINWLYNVMQMRYKLLAEFSARDGVSYTNIWELNDAYPDEAPVQPVVLVIDELADMMLGPLAKAIDKALASLLAKSRAAGIYAIVSTQRPCAKIVTGLVKANISARIALRTASAVDSRIILDQNGAEALGGMGDGLLMYADPHSPTNALIRFQGGVMD